MQYVLNGCLPYLMWHYISVFQAGKGKFNRGRLLNIGVAESLKYDSYDCFIFHDVDLLPEHDQNIYYCDNHAHHLAAAIDEMRYQLVFCGKFFLI